MVIAIALLSLLAVVSAQPIDPSSVPCGIPNVQPITKRIVGGTIAAAGSWPWVILMVNSIGIIEGSGTIVHPHIFLTSAQHFEGRSYSLRYWRVYAGKYNISTTDPYQQFYHINRVLIHPGYNRSTVENDVAIVVTREPIAFNAHTRPACLPDPTHVYTQGQTCYLPGWGSTKGTGNEEVLNQVALPILPDADCSAQFRAFVPAKEICAGYTNGGKDFCSQDVGSPLMCKDQNGAWYIQGIASAGGNCTVADKPGVFDDLGQHAAWIKTTMAALNYPYAY